MIDPLPVRRFGVQDIDGCRCDSSWECGDHSALAQEAISKPAIVIQGESPDATSSTAAKRVYVLAGC